MKSHHPTPPRRNFVEGEFLLNELKNDIRRETPASFEPSIDYAVTKIPGIASRKFSQVDPALTTQMKNIGEAMAICQTAKENPQKCLRSLRSTVW